MDYHITIKKKEAFEWMKGLINNTIADKNHEATIAAYPHLQAWVDAFEEAEASKDNSDKTTPVGKEQQATKKRPAKKRRKRKPAIDKSGLTCNAHPTYSGTRVPRKDCKDCWDVYKKFHPLEYDMKRRSFLAKQRQAAANTKTQSQ